MPVQQRLLQDALNFAPDITLGEAYRHVSSSVVLEDFIQRLEPSGLTRDTCSLNAIKALANSGHTSDKDRRRLFALCKLVVRAQKTRVRLTRDYWLTQRNAVHVSQKKT